MKRILSISVLLLVAAMGLSFGSIVEDAWWISFEPSERGDYPSDNYLLIGWDTDYTDGIDDHPIDGYEDVQPWVFPGETSAVVDSLFPGTGDHYSLSDFRAPVSEDPTPKTWNCRIYYIMGEGSSNVIDPIQVSVAQEGPDYDYSFGPIRIFCPDAIGQQEWIFDADNPWQDFVFMVPGNPVEQYASLTVTAGPVVPEPGSMLTLAGGLLGFAGIGLRKRVQK